MPVDEAKLTEFALGILDDSEYETVREAISKSPLLQKQLEEINNALKNVALAEDRLSPGEQLKNSVLDSIKARSCFEGFKKRFAEFFDLDISTSQNLLAKIHEVSDPVWESILFPGVTLMKFSGGPKVAKATCGIVQIKSGILFPAHQHQAEERIFVLQGFAKDDNSRVLSAGDVFSFKAGSKHSFRVISDENFVFAVVLFQQNKWLLVKTLLDSFRIKNS